MIHEHSAGRGLRIPRTTGATPGPVVVVLVAAMLVAGCGRKPAGEAESGVAATPAADSGEDRGACSLLTAEQVATVLPGHDGGMRTGGSLLKTVTSLQCSYTRVEGTDAQLLTVIVHEAQDDAAFEQIMPSESFRRDHEAVAVGDGAWVYGEADDLKLQMLKGRNVVELELMAPGAQAKKDAIVELARLVADKVS